MRITAFLSCLILFLFSTSCTSLGPKEHGSIVNHPYPPIETFEEVEKKTSELIAKYGPTNVLVVCDLDNTLLAMNQDLGSVQWYDWQKTFASDHPDRVMLKDMNLLEIQWLLYSNSGMHPPEQALPEILGKLQNKNVTTLILTSRSPPVRDATRRELVKNGYLLARTALNIPQENKNLESYCPFEPPSEPKEDQPCTFTDHHQGKYQLTPQEINYIQTKGVRPVSYAQGVYMTAGQHKGAMLKTILTKSKKNFKGIIFVDDTNQHVENVYDSFKETDIEIVSYLYTQEAEKVKFFEQGDKHNAKTSWKLFRETSNAIFK
ncbi:DUF2608 domain-containing protein [Candidatus Nitrospira neomarina]|uniref:DUF2608 domain-containing protein n=1 Tax=Candidatus Nitrospira neomarina TaxID=3020899 RepID=A0AA96JWT3_9BACT|nr:DUF2608 domain-containing protein [Candidatus Nitrospira neomarina]WNM63132.1 DUF2608 domain-containing protein [Candidatus Nitrospira neomarina]